jgi:hypothetical protein
MWSFLRDLVLLMTPGILPRVVQVLIAILALVSAVFSCAVHS